MYLVPGNATGIGNFLNLKLLSNLFSVKQKWEPFAKFWRIIQFPLFHWCFFDHPAPQNLYYLDFLDVGSVRVMPEL